MLIGQWVSHNYGEEEPLRRVGDDDKAETMRVTQRGGPLGAMRSGQRSVGLGGGAIPDE